MLLIPDDIFALNVFGKGLQKDLLYHIPKDQHENGQGYSSPYPSSCTSWWQDDVSFLPNFGTFPCKMEPLHSTAIYKWYMQP